MAKGSSGGTASTWRSGTNKVTPGAERLIAAVQSGKYEKMDYDRRSKLYDDAALESKSLNIKDAEERYNAEQLKALAYYHSSLFDDINTIVARKSEIRQLYDFTGGQKDADPTNPTQ